MTTVAGPPPSLSGRGSGPTIASVWQGTVGSPIADGLLEWPPDLFALTDVILERAEVYRFVLSPPINMTWPPGGGDDWVDAVAKTAREWSVWAEAQDGSVPSLLAQEWDVVRGRAELPLEHLAEGRDWRLCEALLTVHAVADEACAGLFVALDRSDGEGCIYRARGRELLARTGSLARFHSGLIRVLPKVRTPPTGGAAFSRYACVQAPEVKTHWHKLPARHPGTDPQAEHANMLLLPWPMRVRESDFRAVEGSVQRLTNEPFGFFEFAPADRLDLDLVDRMLVAALDEVGNVDVVVLPESAVDVSEISDLEALLGQHGVIYLQAGVREPSAQPGRFGSNWVHIGVNPGLEKGDRQSSAHQYEWFHLRQNKHHRWSLDEGQILQYNLAGALHPQIRWWEAMEVPRLQLQFVQVGEEITIVSLVCEDLAQIDEVADVIRSVGPSFVLAVLLDGPQLASRWAARYASVLADDPGSAVLTLTSLGMAERSRPPGHSASAVIALMKDPVRGMREIALEPGAHGVVLTVTGGRATRRTADGRGPVATGTHYSGTAVHQIHPASVGSRPAAATASARPRALEVDEITILTGWAEGVTEALAYAPEQAEALLADAYADAPWRVALQLPAPTPGLRDAIDSIREILKSAAPSGGFPSFDAVLGSVREVRTDEPASDRLSRRVLRSTLEQLRTRQATSA